MVNKVFNYINESRKELKKVVWPNQKEVTQHTILVIAISVAVAAFIGVSDFVLSLIVQSIL